MVEELAFEQQDVVGAPVSRYLATCGLAST